MVSVKAIGKYIFNLVDFKFLYILKDYLQNQFSQGGQCEVS